MIIQYASDLHLEFQENKKHLKRNPLQPKGDILLLGGDIMTFSTMEEHTDFFDYVSDHYESTYWVPGNHEYYHYDIGTKSGVINESIRSNVHLVNDVAITLNNTKFIFSTLWSKINLHNKWSIERGMNDFQIINYNGMRFTIERANELHENSLAFIKKELRKNETPKTVVLTHHVPTLMHYPKQYIGSALNEAFATELSDFIEEEGPDFWLYGHHHANTADFKIGNTQLLTNQLGYVSYREHGLFNDGKVFEV